MIEIEQRDQNIDVEKCPPQSSSASRSRSKWLEHLLANIVRPNSELRIPKPELRTPNSERRSLTQRARRNRGGGRETPKPSTVKVQVQDIGPQKTGVQRVDVSQEQAAEPDFQLEV